MFVRVRLSWLLATWLGRHLKPGIQRPRAECERNNRRYSGPPFGTGYRHYGGHTSAQSHLVTFVNFGPFAGQIL